VIYGFRVNLRAEIGYLGLVWGVGKGSREMG